MKLKDIFIVILISTIAYLIFNTAKAETFPNNSFTIAHELVGASSFTLISTSTNTILAISITQSGTASNSWVSCGNTIIAKNYAQNVPYQEFRYLCEDNPLTIEKTGQDSAFFRITYTPQNLSLIPDKENFFNSLNLFHAFVIFWISLFFIIWFFRSPKI